MAKTNEIHVRVKRLKDHPVCVTLHNGETYVGYISGVNSEGVVLTGGGKLTQAAITAPSSGSARKPNLKQVLREKQSPLGTVNGRTAFASRRCDPVRCLVQPLGQLRYHLSCLC